MDTMDTNVMQQPERGDVPADAADSGGLAPTQGQPAGEDACRAAQDPAPEAASEPPRRALKFVVTLWPGAAAGYDAVLALGADGCDPLLRAAHVADLAAALEEIPGLLAEAEARWQVQPRYPTGPAGRTRPAAPSRPATSQSVALPSEQASAEPASAPPARLAPADRTGQLSLF